MSSEQPMPTPNDGPSIQALVRADLEERERIGRERYGSSLKAFNDRDADLDLYQELLDAVCYQRQKMEEVKELKRQVAELRAENVQLRRDLGTEKYRADRFEAVLLRERDGE